MPNQTPNGMRSARLQTTRPSALARLFRRGRRAERVGSLLVALLFVVGQLASFHHAATVQHVRCAEHGELVDVDAHGAGDAEGTAFSAGASESRRAAAPATATDHAAMAQAADASGRGHAHEHCTVGPKRGADTSLSLRGAAIARLPQSQPPPPVITARSTAPRIAVVLFAPKNSPPV